MNSNQWVYHRLNKKTQKMEYSVDGINYTKDHYNSDMNEVYKTEEKDNMIERENIEMDKTIDIWEWYDHYEDLIRILYDDFISICSSSGIKIKYNQDSFNDFCCMMYNESKNEYLLDREEFESLLK
jgi:hypothetical protein